MVSAIYHLPGLCTLVLTLPAPAGPMTRTPNFDMLSGYFGGSSAKDNFPQKVFSVIQAKCGVLRFHLCWPAVLVAQHQMQPELRTSDATSSIAPTSFQSGSAWKMEILVEMPPICMCSPPAVIWHGAIRSRVRRRTAGRGAGPICKVSPKFFSPLDEKVTKEEEAKTGRENRLRITALSIVANSSEP
jgi:hypothetical protein